MKEKLKTAYLVRVTSDNHNQEISMFENEDGRFTLTHNRIGASPLVKRYPMTMWNKIYRKKISDGWTDESGISGLSLREVPKYGEISDKAVAGLVDYLLKAANEYVKKNYLVTERTVTEKMIAEARKEICQMAETTDVETFNGYLLELFKTIPRKMETVKQYLAKSDGDMLGIIDREISLLDAMEGQVSIKKPEQKKNILELSGLEIRECTDYELAEVRKTLGGKYFARAKGMFRVSNRNSERKFQAFCRNNHYTKSNIRLLFHGSGSANWWNILLLGLSVKNASPLGMFGAGVYFADDPGKSLNYCGGDRRFLAIFQTAYNKPYDIWNWDHACQKLNKKKLYAMGRDIVFAHKDLGMLRRNEYVSYQDDQHSIKYLIEF